MQEHGHALLHPPKGTSATAKRQRAAALQRTVDFAAGGNSDAELGIHIPGKVFAGLRDTDTISIGYRFTAATAGPDTIGIGEGDGSVFIPEPSTILLLLLGLGGSLSRRRRSQTESP